MQVLCRWFGPLVAAVVGTDTFGKVIPPHERRTLIALFTLTVS